MATTGNRQTTDPSFPTSPSWCRESVRGWRLWLQGGLLWKATVAVLILLHLSFLPWPRRIHKALDREVPRYWLTLWSETAWDTHQFSNRPAADFFAIYEAGYRTLRGMDPYSVNTDRTPRAAPSDFASFRYVPITAVWLAAPLSLLPPWIAFIFWLLLNEVFLLFNLGLTAAGSPVKRRRALGALWLAFFPLHIEWHMGQFSFFMGCLLFWSALALWQGRARIATAAWGLSTWLKNWSVLFWPYWVLSRRHRWMATIWVVLLVVTTLGYFTLQPESLSVFRERATDRRSAGSADDVYWGRQGVQMIPAVLVAGGRLPDQRHPPTDSDAGNTALVWRSDLAVWINLLLSIGSFGVIAVGMVRLWRRQRKQFSQLKDNQVDTTSKALAIDLFALVWLWWFIAYLDTWEHHYVMLLPLIALLGITRRLSGMSLWIPALLWGLPSLWVPTREAFSTQDPGAFVWVILYFLQRPVGVVWVFWVIGKRVLGVSPPVDGSEAIHSS